ncbi:hypothetical protein C9439_03770 [archaeon SCG-AAA382B04]|nr:hypothetical protein C9439_03770 [archaeon SCG-AAA382B04]
MPGEYIKDVERWISKKELVDLIKEKKIEAKLLERLYFIKFLYEGDNVPEASDKVEISNQTGYRWRKKWNKKGIEGLEPEYDGGPKPKLKLKKKEKEELKEKLKERDNWTTREIKNLIKERFDVEYSSRHTRRILEEMGMKNGKPYQQDHRRPENAEQQLKKTEKKQKEN